MHTKIPLRRIALALTITAALSIGSVAYSQEEEDDVFELSPFVVDTSSDMGYLAQNTLSGGRFNVNLGDTAASVSVFTEEFLEDFGIQDVDDLTKYTLGTVIDTMDDLATTNINQVVNAERIGQSIRIRGIQATKGTNFYQSIVPDDGYRNGRYDESRGPNGILFGISNAGGMVSSSTLQGNIYKDSLKLKYTTGSYNENRSEIQGNKVIIKDKLGVAMAGLYEDSEGWMDWTQDDRKSVYAAMTFRPNNRISIRAMGEKGERYSVQPRPMPINDNFSYWLDLGSPTAVPYGLNWPLEEAGVSRNSNNIQQTRAASVGQDPRHVYISDLGELHNLAATFVTSNGYRNLIEPLPGDSVGSLNLNRPDLFPYNTSFEGPDVFRDTEFSWYQIDTDIMIIDNLYLNLGHNSQDLEMDVSYTPGGNPSLQGDPNVTLGVTIEDPLGWVNNKPRELVAPDQDLINQNLNPFAGQLYVEAGNGHSFQQRWSSSEESRIALSYDLITDSWLGNHRIAASYSEREVSDHIESTKLAFLDSPFHPDPFHPRNRIYTRTYIDLNDRSTWGYTQDLLPYDREATTTIVVNDFSNPSAVGIGIPSDGVEREIGWVSDAGGRTHTRVDQFVDAKVIVSQSSFLNNRLIFTLGYREDNATVEEFGLKDGGRFGTVVDVESGPITSSTFVGESKAAGSVFHLTKNFSLVANYTTSIGLPNFNINVLPENFRENAQSVFPPPPDGEGTDFGIGFKLFDNRISGRIAYFTTNSVNETRGVVFGAIGQSNNRALFDYLEGILLGTDKYPQEVWDDLDSKLNSDAEISSTTWALLDTESEGYEFTLVANPTRSLRISMNFSYTDRQAMNLYKRGIPWLGYIKDEVTGLPKSFYTARDATDEEMDEEGLGYAPTVYTFDTTNLDTEGTVAQFIALTEEASIIEGRDLFNVDGNVTNRSIGEVLVEQQYMRLRNQVEGEQKRWGLRPLKANIQGAYDLKEGMLKGVSIGGGFRWQSADIIGGDPVTGEEWKGKELFEADFMLRYSHKPFGGKGTITYQLNIYNLFDDQSIIPQRLAAYPDTVIPDGSGRGAYERFSFQQPRSFRLSVTYQF